VLPFFVWHWKQCRRRALGQSRRIWTRRVGYWMCRSSASVVWMRHPAAPPHPWPWGHREPVRMRGCHGCPWWWGGVQSPLTAWCVSQDMQNSRTGKDADGFQGTTAVHARTGLDHASCAIIPQNGARVSCTPHGFESPGAHVVKASGVHTCAGSRQTRHASTVRASFEGAFMVFSLLTHARGSATAASARRRCRTFGRRPQLVHHTWDTATAVWAAHGESGWLRCFDGGACCQQHQHQHQHQHQQCCQGLPWTGCFVGGASFGVVVSRASDWSCSCA